VRLGLLSSHRGSGVQAVLDACTAGRLAITPALVISNNADAEVLTRAARHGVPHAVLSGRTHPDPDALDLAIRDALTGHGVELILLTGYLKKLGPRTLERFAGRVLNIHPALLPKYGGQGMYGQHVHAAVLAAGDAESGVTIHLVDAEYDHGRIVAQCRVPVVTGDTVETLAARVLAREHAFIVETLDAIVSGRVKLP
jgi:phosphoribosylglycinamide formyltransferase-1